MSLNKKQRRRRALRRAAIDLGVGGLFFYLGGGDTIRCSTRLDTKRHGLIKSSGTLKSILKSDVYYGWARPTTYKFIFEDDGMEFEKLSELKKYLLIKKIAGIK